MCITEEEEYREEHKRALELKVGRVQKDLKPHLKMEISEADRKTVKSVRKFPGGHFQATRSTIGKNSGWRSNPTSQKVFLNRWFLTMER